MTTSPRVSVVVPAFNVEPWLGEALTSVLQQSVPAFEILVVDDGSTDRTGDVARSFPGVSVVAQPNRGLAAARNAGAERATGDALFFLDADDVLLTDALERTIEVMFGSTAPAAVVPNFTIVGATPERPGWSPTGSTRVLERRSLRRVLRSNPLAANALMRWEVWRALRFREELCAAEDLELWIRMLLDGYRIALMPEVLVRVRRGRAGALTSKVRLMRESRRAVFASLWHRPGLDPGERALIAYQLVRTSAGVLLSPRVRQRRIGEERISCVHVHLDAPGGGLTHLRLLRDALDDRVGWTHVELHQSRLRVSLPGWVAAIRDVRRQLADRTVVHAHGVRAAAVCAVATLGKPNPLVVTVHGLHSVRRSRSQLLRWANRAVLRRAARVLVLSDSDARTLQARRLVRPERVRSVRAAFAHPRRFEREQARPKLSLRADDQVVLWLGRFSAEKDPVTFVEAIARVPNVIGLVAGEGPLAGAVGRATRAMGGGSRIRTIGWVDEPGMVMSASDVFVSTSRWEGLPLAALEAASCGLALVLTDVPGNRDLAAMGIPAVLVPPGDPTRLAEAIGALVGDLDRRREMGAEAASMAGGAFSPGRLAEDVLAVYRELARAAGTPGETPSV